MRREVSCEGDRGKATRVANRFDAVCEVTSDHWNKELVLTVDRDGFYTLRLRHRLVVNGWLDDRQHNHYPREGIDTTR